ncbi:MAG: transcriptional regulator NanR, partial [Rhizobiales bacterium]|nr:transcriptional regulator NanR [Hyphomicrobiales bacterium]
TMPDISPIARRKLFQEVRDRLLERIRSGEFRAGDQLPSERDLMQAYQVGRPAVREALQALERDGIIQVTHGERARVTLPTAEKIIDQIAGSASHLLHAEPGNLDHLKDARRFLETGLAHRAAAMATPDGVARLRERLSTHERARLKLDEFLPRDMEFHREIAVMTGNPIFPALVEAMFGWLSVYYSQLVRVQGAEDLTIAEHRRIFEAIAAGDPEAAAEAMHHHISRGNALYRKLEERGR